MCAVRYMFKYTHVFHNKETLVRHRSKKNSWTIVNAWKVKFFPNHLGHSCHCIGNPGLGFNCRTHTFLVLTYLPLNIELGIRCTFGSWTDYIPCVWNFNTQVYNTGKALGICFYCDWILNHSTSCQTGSADGRKWCGEADTNYRGKTILHVDCTN